MSSRKWSISRYDDMLRLPWPPYLVLVVAAVPDSLVPSELAKATMMNDQAREAEEAKSFSLCNLILIFLSREKRHKQTVIVFLKPPPIPPLHISDEKHFKTGTQI